MTRRAAGLAILLLTGIMAARGADATPLALNGASGFASGYANLPEAEDGEEALQLALPAEFFARLGGEAASDEGMRQIARSLREDNRLQELLRSIDALRVAEPSAARPRGRQLAANGDVPLELPGGDERASLLGERAEGQGGESRGAAAAPGRQAAAAARVGSGAPADADIEPGDTLRGALRELVAGRRGSLGPNAARGEGDDDGTGLGLGQSVLESRLLGEAVEAFVHREGDSTFSLFGVGRFAFDASDDLRNLSISELTTGISVALAPREPQSPHGEGKTVDLFALVKSYLMTPTGTLSTIAATIMLLVWGMVRMAAKLRR